MSSLRGAFSCPNIKVNHARFSCLFVFVEVCEHDAATSNLRKLSSARVLFQKWLRVGKPSSSFYLFTVLLTDMMVGWTSIGGRSWDSASALAHTTWTIRVGLQLPELQQTRHLSLDLLFCMILALQLHTNNPHVVCAVVPMTGRYGMDSVNIATADIKMCQVQALMPLSRWSLDVRILLPIKVRC